MTERRVIALAIDGSEYAEYAFEWYVKYLHHPCNVLCILHGIDSFNVEKAQKEIAKGGQMKESLERQYSRITELEEKYQHKMQKHKINGNVLSIPAKNAGQAIIEAATEEGAFALVMGTRGRNKLKKVLMGSVSDYVVKNSDIPVIVVRKKEASPDK